MTLLLNFSLNKQQQNSCVLLTKIPLWVPFPNTYICVRSRSIRSTDWLTWFWYDVINSSVLSAACLFDFSIISMSICCVLGHHILYITREFICILAKVYNRAAYAQYNIFVLCIYESQKQHKNQIKKLLFRWIFF